MKMLKTGEWVKVNNNTSPHFGEYGTIIGMRGEPTYPYEVDFGKAKCTYNKNELLLIVDQFTVPDDALFRLETDLKKVKVKDDHE